MPLKNIIRDLRDGIGSMSRRRFEVKLPYYLRSRSHSAVLDESQFRNCVAGQSCWANMPPEILRDVIQRIEKSEGTWPYRKHVVACAGVCRAWREITKDLVKTPELCGKITFPISLKQAGPRDTMIQCFIKRDRAKSTYHLFLGLTTTLADCGKFLLAARRVRRATCTDYIITFDTDDMFRGSKIYVGKLRSNFLGTKFTIYDSQQPYFGTIASSSKMGRRVFSKRVSPRIPAGSFSIAHIAYELNVLGTRGPRRMHCTMHSIPASSIAPGGTLFTPMEFTSSVDDSLASLPYFGSRSAMSDFSTTETEILCSSLQDCPLILKNKAPRWHEQLQCWCLNFRGRVTIASVKNFQLVSAMESGQTASQSDHDKVLLQFGKVGKDMFTMDYRYPLSAFQAFAICLSSFDTKLACE